MRKKDILRAPWKIDGSFDDGVDVAIIDADGSEILGISPQDGVDLDAWGERSIAIAHLVVAAPELFDALKRLDYDSTDPEAQRASRAAIAKAEDRA